MKEDRIFLDTNVLVYAHDISAVAKHKIAQKIVFDLWNSNSGVLSTQVLQELFVTLTGKIPKPIKTKLAKEIVSALLKWEIVVNNGESILSAIEIQSQHHFSFWDSLIIEAAIRGGATLLLSEDLPDGQIVEGIRIKNPFDNLSQKL